MSMYDNAFIKKLATIPFVGDFLLTHEKPEEAIQGGQANEHYHLTEVEHTFVQALIVSGTKLYTPVTANCELMFTTDGDVMMGWDGVSYA